MNPIKMSNEQQPTVIPEADQDRIDNACTLYGLAMPEEDLKRRRPIQDCKGGAEWQYRFLAPEIAALTAERDVYRKALQEVYSEGMFGYINGDVAGTLAKMAKKALDQYPSPKIDKDNG